MFSRSIAISRSKSSKSSSATVRAAPSSVMPRSRAAAAARESGGLPTCQLPVPAESISTSPSMPASRSSERMTPSAVGERQILPRHTKRMRTMRGFLPRDPVLDVRDRRRVHDLERLELALARVLQQALAVAQQDGDDVQVELLEVACR